MIFSIGTIFYWISSTAHIAFKCGFNSFNFNNLLDFNNLFFKSVNMNYIWYLLFNFNRTFPQSLGLQQLFQQYFQLEQFSQWSYHIQQAGRVEHYNSIHLFNFFNFDNLFNYSINGDNSWYFDYFLNNFFDNLLTYTIFGTTLKTFKISSTLTTPIIYCLIIVPNNSFVHLWNNSRLSFHFVKLFK